MASRALRLTITGRVQGVGFRAWAVRQARGHGLDGWVRNRDDRAVEMVIAGPEAALAAMRKDCKRGPTGARVDRVAETLELEPVSAGFRQRATSSG